MDEIKAYMTENQELILEDIKYIVESASPTNDKQLVDECGQRIQTLFEKYFSYRAAEITEQKYGNHLRFEYGDGEEKLLILSHFDTVWDKDELTYKEGENRIYGPGILDMKGGLVQAIWALKACKDLTIQLDKKIVFLCTSDEEVGSPSSKKLINNEAKTSSYALVTEPPVAGTGALKTERKGSARYHINIVGKAAHSGNHHEDGISAIKEAAEQIIYLESLTDYEKGTTVNVGVVEGGGPLNVVADSASIGVDFRMETTEEQKRIEHIMEELTPQAEGATLEVQGGIMRPPMHRDETTEKMFEHAEKVAKELDMELEEASVGGGSDGNFTANMGVPTLDGLGAAGTGIHARNEHILKNQIPERAALLCKLICSL
ncbi:M20 family metallopeptidase [Halobacillus amylolyticus]|uniref:M20 family metallopeptidase n=1 Tax=Halobacillus amylolyticus TaxID=2932259 RepID=A0ABY4H9E3_9BACI|nr:M20 family metallopeptidase [Halobacillus amylolyticus]UOR11422.1 M20 family metallopeptidase [Halobacillus amylolyticus]